MIWFLVLHISALVIWCAALLYLPALISGLHDQHTSIDEPDNRYGSVARFVFTTIATPSALCAIFAGTVVFLLNGTVEVWLVIKLTLVVGLVICHTIAGFLLLKTQDPSKKPITRWCHYLNAALWLLIVAIFSVVLAKPAPGVLP